MEVVKLNALENREPHAEENARILSRLLVG